MLTLLFSCLVFSGCGKKQVTSTEPIPLPEHPRPDFSRTDWINLNGRWSFALDSLDVGAAREWFREGTPFPDTITVPFSWASPLSGIGRKDVHIAWYARDFEVPKTWDNRFVFLVIGASDFTTKVWVNGHEIGVHEGGYTPFEFEITEALFEKGANHLVIRVEDEPTPGRLVGKQVYGEAKGIWQTVYLEPRSELHLKMAHFSPDIDRKLVKMHLAFSAATGMNDEVSIAFADTSIAPVRKPLPPGQGEFTLTIPVPKPHLWNLDDPYLYNVDITLISEKAAIDTVHTYFGMRKIGAAYRPNSRDMYVTLNNKPVYLRMTLDQSYHPEGFCTFPSDEFMRGEIERAKTIGLNCLRIHIKTEMPRKLYWADRLGLLLMCDIPNINGEPTEYGRKNWEYTAFNQIERDYNHPSIFSWVLFNETWGLVTRIEKLPGEFVHEYMPETQAWVKSMYLTAKNADPTRLVEDNSPDQGRRWHVMTDINSWHAYLPGYRWAEYMDEVVRNTFPGSEWNFIGGNKQPDIPMMNSECGNVWGYKGGTGDVDISYEYHIMMNEYRRRPRISGFLFTEFHDVINEWNGYYRFDRSMKDFGLDELCPGMTVRDFHSDLYLIPGGDFKKIVAPGDTFSVPVTASFLSDTVPGELTVKTLFHGWNRFGDHREYSADSLTVRPVKYSVVKLPDVKLTAPKEECIAMFCTFLIDAKGDTLHRNFLPVRVLKSESPRRETIKGKAEIVRRMPNEFSKSEWSVKQKAIFDSLKVWGTGTGYFEYEFPWPKNLKADAVQEIEFIAELGARRIQGKDMGEDYVSQGIDNISAKGIDPGHNPNSYPMTDDKKHPSQVGITLNDTDSQAITLANDPADHRGNLSWLSQKEDDTLTEAGSYGYLVKVQFGGEALKKAAEEGTARVKLAVTGGTGSDGGLSVYGEQFGRYIIDPTVVFRLK
ncbi:beta galactosidase jelly roll domain-containing protein [bacterium]|nr:beta galactosidase jelly roll domain-containing protein [bacterium]